MQLKKIFFNRLEVLIKKIYICTRRTLASLSKMLKFATKETPKTTI